MTIDERGQLTNSELAYLYCEGKDCRDCRFVYETGCLNKLAEWFNQKEGGKE